VPERSRLRFEMTCPGCRYHYFLEVFDPYEIETCPLCGKRYPLVSATAGFSTRESH
jgi:rRNA maturation endonuclease Nob1